MTNSVDPDQTAPLVIFSDTFVLEILGHFTIEWPHQPQSVLQQSVRVPTNVHLLSAR